MKLFIVILLACIALGSCDDSTLSSSRIVGGTAVAQINQFNFMTQLRRDHFGTGAWHQQCGGVLIHARLVLTSANCFYGVPYALRWRVRAGTLSRLEGGLERLVLNIFLHPNYNSLSLQNNLAIVELLSPLPLAANSNINVADLVPAATLPPTANLNILGWGATVFNGIPNTVLHAAPVTVAAQAACIANYASIHFLVGNTNICVGTTNIGICSRDEGGPLMGGTPSLVHGIASFVVGCGNAEFPSVFTLVSPFRPWIDTYTIAIQN